MRHGKEPSSPRGRVITAVLALNSRTSHVSGGAHAGQPFTYTTELWEISYVTLGVT